ncbi:MAG: AI-2E family transporter [Phycisphaerales bacterium]|nr:AI-2E family transporter [Planctomycetota bacterium]MCH8507462.1 AI-2E family transporter [Phycisphaerales bacterium]
MTDPDSSQRSLPDWARLHLWQMQPVRDVLLGLAVLGLFIVGQKTSVVTVPLLLAILLAYLFEPVIAWSVRRLGLHRRVVVGGIIGLVLLFVVVPAVVGATIGVAQLAGFGSRIAENIQTVQEAREAETEEEAEAVFAAWAERQGEEDFSPMWRWVYEQVSDSEEDPSAVRQVVAAGVAWIDANREQVATTAATFGMETIGRVLRWIGALFGFGFMAFLTVFFFFFTATEWVKLKGFGTKLLPDKNRDRILDLLVKFDRVVSGFIRGRLTIAFLQAIIFSVGYYIVGVPGAFILGPAVAILAIVPYLSMLGIPVSVLLLWLEGHTGIRGAWWWVLGAPTAIYAIGQALDDYVFSPVIQGKSTGLDAPMILFATLAGGALFGFFGLLIAIPIAACLKILIQEIFWPRFKEWAEGRKGDPLPID